MTCSDLRFHRVSVAAELRLDKTSKTDAVIQSTSNSGLGQRPAAQVVRNGQVLEIF